MTIWFPFSATIQKEENTYISICPEADVVCRGETVEEAILNLKNNYSCEIFNINPEYYKA